MVRLLFALLASLVLLACGGTWYAVSTDQWPGDDRQPPATFVWAFNARLGRLLYDHGQDPPLPPPPPPPREELTKAEQADVKKVLATDPRFKDRVFPTGPGLALAGPRRG